MPRPIPLSLSLPMPHTHAPCSCPCPCCSRCGIDPDKPLEASEVGSERITAAFNAMMEGEPKAHELLDQALEKFQVGEGGGAL